MSHELDRDSMVLSNYLNDFIARDQGLIQRFIEPAGCHRQTNSELELEPAGSKIVPQPISTIQKKKLFRKI